MKGEWCYFKSYIPPEICRDLIQGSMVFPEIDALVGNNPPSATVGFDADGAAIANYGTISPIRKSKIRFIPATYLVFEQVFDLLWRTALRANKDFFNFHLTKLDSLQFTEYDAAYEGEYKKHKDVFWINNEPEYHRKLSLVIQLSDPTDYDGGDLVLDTEQDSPNAEELRCQGTIIFFPSFLHHQVTKVTRGKRYSLVGWIDGPKWR